MKNFLIILLAVVISITEVYSYADEEKPNQLRNEVEVRGYDRNDPTGRLYLEKEITPDMALSLSFFGTKDQQEITAGPVYYFTPQLSVGAGFGISYHKEDSQKDKKLHPAVSTFIYYKDDNWEAELLAERYRNTPSYSLYGEGYVQRKVIGGLSVGAFAQSDLGVGPKVSYQINDNISLWVSAPVKKFKGSKTEALGGLKIDF